MKKTFTSFIILLLLPLTHLAGQYPATVFAEDFSTGWTYGESLITQSDWGTNQPTTVDDYVPLSVEGETFMRYRAGVVTNKSIFPSAFSEPIDSNLSYEFSLRVLNTQFGQTGDPSGNLNMTWDGPGGVALGTFRMTVGNASQTQIDFGPGDGGTGVPALSTQTTSETLQPNVWYTLTLIFDPAAQTMSFTLKDADDTLISSNTGTLTGGAENLTEIRKVRFSSGSFASMETDFHVTDISVTAIPEPGTTAIIISVLAFGLVMVRTRYRRSGAL